MPYKGLSRVPGTFYIITVIVPGSDIELRKDLPLQRRAGEADAEAGGSQPQFLVSQVCSRIRSCGWWFLYRYGRKGTIVKIANSNSFETIYRL
jgi:hypothetical protein